MEHGRKAFPPGRKDALPPIRQEVNWDVKARLEDMDRASVDVNVLFPTHVSSYCALRDVGFENALYRAYHRWVVDFCAQAPKRLKWTLVANMRDVPSGVAELKYWAERDPNLVGVYISPQAPGGKLLDNPDLYPLYDAAQSLDLPLLGAWRHGAAALWPRHARPRRRLVPAARAVEPVGRHGGDGRPDRRRHLRPVPAHPGGDHRDRRRLGPGGARPLRHALPDVAGPRAEPEADAARGPRRGPLFPRHRQLGALDRVLRRGTGRGHVAVRAATGRTATAPGPKPCSRPSTARASAKAPGRRSWARTRCASARG